MAAVAVLVFCVAVIVLHVVEARTSKIFKKAQDDHIEYTAVLRGEEANWVKDLKDFVNQVHKELGKQNVHHHLMPVIEILEQTYRVRITDISIDGYGNVHVQYRKKERGYHYLEDSNCNGCDKHSSK